MRRRRNIDPASKNLPETLAALPFALSPSKYIPLRHTSPRKAGYRFAGSGVSFKANSSGGSQDDVGRRWRRWRRHEFVTLTQIAVLGGGPAGRVAGLPGYPELDFWREIAAENTLFASLVLRPETGFQLASQPTRVSHKRDR